MERGGASSDDLADVLKENVKKAKLLADKHDKVVLLKMISYPSGGWARYDDGVQLEFFKEIREFFCSDVTFPHRSVGMSYFSAFDIAWKSTDDGWDPREAYLGLFRRDDSAKGAVEAFTSPCLYFDSN